MQDDELELDLRELADDIEAPQTALPAKAPPKFVTPKMEAHFSPRGGCTAIIVREIRAERKHIRMQAYGLTSQPIAEALIEAHKNGVDVKVIADKSAAGVKSSQVPVLVAAGVPVLIDGAHAIAHNKIVILGRATVITGSFNFTKQAESGNAENILLVRSGPLAAAYLKNWDLHAEHAAPSGS